MQLILYPALVQGEGAAASIVNGIHALDDLGVDVMIVGRGGGSMEDLWAFNEKIVARAIFECRTPVISAVGHETDVTIADFVADLRAPTPSAAAELAVYDIREFTEQLGNYYRNLNKLMEGFLDAAREKVLGCSKKLELLKPENRLNDKKQYCADLESKLLDAMNLKLMAARHRLELCSQGLEGVSPLKKLSQGYSVVTDREGRTITDVHMVEKEDLLTVHLLNGQIDARVTEKRVRNRSVSG